jgi:hypothetical protein
LVEIPAVPNAAGAPAAFPDGVLRVAWQQEPERAVLKFEITTPDKFLPSAAAQNLAGAPYPAPAPLPDVALSGAAPLWLFGVYARWLVRAGARSLASWDARTQSYIRIWS